MKRARVLAVRIVRAVAVVSAAEYGLAAIEGMAARVGRVAILLAACSGCIPQEPGEQATPARAAEDPNAFPAGYGVFRGSMTLTVMDLEGGKQAIAPFPTFHNVSGVVTWRSKKDGLVHSIAVNAACPWKTATQLRLFNEGAKEPLPERGVVLIDFDHRIRTPYKGRIEEVE